MSGRLAVWLHGAYRHVVIAAALLAGLVKPAIASAQERSRVFVLSEGAPLLAARLRSELGTLGFDTATSFPGGEPAAVCAAPGAVALETPGGRLGPASARAELGAQGAAAALCVRATATRATLLLIPAGADPEQTYELARAPRTSDALFAIQLAELVRTSLLALHAPAHAMDARGAPLSASALAPAAQGAGALDDELPPVLMAAHSRARSPRRARLSAELGLGPLASGSLPPVPALAASLGGFVGEALRLELYTLAALKRMEVERSDGQTLSHVVFLGTDARIDFLRASRLRGYAAPGVALSFFTTERWISGGPGPFRHISPYASVYLRGGVGYRIARAISLRAELVVGSYIDSAVVMVGADHALHWGLPWLASLLAFETRLL